MHSKDIHAEKLLQNVVHDLRQPLGTIETSAYLLNRMLGGAEGQTYQHLCTIERQVDLAARILNEAVAELSRLRSLPGTQPAADESLAFTKSETAVVT
jgi:signal transduction histidine kinase